MRTLNDLHEAFAALDAAAPTELSERVTGRSRSRRVGRVIAITAVAAAVAVIAVIMPWTVERLSRSDAPQSGAARSGALAYELDGDIYVADLDGSNPVDISAAIPDAGCEGAGGYQMPSWSPDGRYLAFRHQCTLSVDNVVITDPHGDVVAQIPADKWGFAWSPDSTRVAVWETFGETIAVYGVDGKRQASLNLPRRMFPHADDGPGVWMPDGSALLLYGRFVVPLDGSAPHDLALGGQNPGGSASYSPDGTRVAVVTDNSVTVVAADGSPVSEVVAPLPEGVQAWSPDGDRLASYSNHALLVVDVASGAVTPLTEAVAALPVGSRILGIRGFSPQGDRILYETGDGNGLTSALWSIGVDGSDPRIVVAGTTQGEWLSPASTS